MKKGAAFSKNDSDAGSDKMGDVEIGDNPTPEYLMNLDKIYHWDDISTFVLFIVFILVNGAVGYLSPPSKAEFIKSSPVLTARNSTFSRYTIGIESITSRNSYVRMKVRYSMDYLSASNKTNNLVINTSMKYDKAKSDHTKHAFKSSNVVFHSLSGHESTDWHTIYYERIVDFNKITAEICVCGNESDFSTFEIEASLGSQSDARIQICIRVVYTVVMCIVFSIFSNKMKTVEVRHEQSLSQSLLFITCFLNNPTIIINYMRPNLFVTIFDDIMKSFYCGYLTLFIFVVLGHCGIKEKFQGEFLNDRLSIASTVGLVVFSRELCTDLAQIYNPMLAVDSVDKWLCGAEYFLLFVCVCGLIYEAVKARKRIDDSEYFRFCFYIVCALICIFILFSTQRLFFEYSTIKFLLTVGSANVLALAMAYGHYPFSMKEGLAYKDAQEVDIGSMSDDLELMDAEGQLKPQERPLPIIIDDDDDDDDEDAEKIAPKVHEVSDPENPNNDQKTTSTKKKAKTKAKRTGHKKKNSKPISKNSEEESPNQ